VRAAFIIVFLLALAPGCATTAVTDNFLKDPPATNSSLDVAYTTSAGEAVRVECSDGRAAVAAVARTVVSTAWREDAAIPPGLLVEGDKPSDSWRLGSIGREPVDEGEATADALRPRRVVIGRSAEGRNFILVEGREGWQRFVPEYVKTSHRSRIRKVVGAALLVPAVTFDLVAWPIEFVVFVVGVTMSGGWS
jgi:hypothetical protein